MISAYINSWQEAIVTVVILLWVAFICCGTLVGLWLCRDNNEWGILIASLALPIIGTVLALTIMQLKYKSVDHWIKQMKQKTKKTKNSKRKKHR